MELIPDNIEIKKNSVAIIGCNEGSSGQIHSWIQEETDYHIACFVNISEEILIAFNGEYLREILEKTGTETASVFLKDSQSAALILPTDNNETVEKQSLLMPIRLN